MKTNELYDKLHILFLNNENVSESELKDILYKSEGKPMDDYYQSLFIAFIAYLYSRKHNINHLTSIPLINYEENEQLSFQEFIERIAKYEKLIVPDTDEVKFGDISYYNYAMNTIENYVLQADDDWYRVNSSIINDDAEQQELFKMYVPVNNFSIHLFATLLVAKCEARKVNYNFKMNINPNRQLGNNVEITINIKNSHAMIEIIEEIIEENPDIMIDHEKLPLVSYSLTDNIGVIPVLFNGNYEDVICDEIINTKNKGGTFGTFTETMDRRFQHYFKDIKTVYNIQENRDEKTTIL